MTGCIKRAGHRQSSLFDLGVDMEEDQDRKAASARAAMVEGLKARGHGDRAVLAAMERVPRHRFVSEVWVNTPGKPVSEVTVHRSGDADFLELAYHPARSLLVRMVEGVPTSAASAPTIVADMLAWAQLGRGMKVLEIGAGTGYNAALIAELVGDPALVTTVDIDAGLAASARETLTALGYGGVQVILGDGFAGHANRAPHDRIIATVGCPDLSPAWFDQLAPDGLMLIPLAHDSWHPLMRVKRSDSGGEGITVGRSAFVAIQGEMDRPGPWPARFPAPPEPDQEPVPLPAWVAEVFRDAPEAGSYPVPLWHFSYYLALADMRTRYWGLDDHDGCFAAVDHAASEITRRGQHGAQLGMDLIGHLEGWRTAGCPDPERYLHRFRPLASVPGEYTWAIERAWFRQETTLVDHP